MTTHKLLQLLLLFILFGLNATDLLGQLADHVPREVLIKWKPFTPNTQRLNLRTTVKAKTLKQFRELDIEVWKLGQDQSLTVQDVIKEYYDHPSIEFIEPNYIYSISEFIPDDFMFDNQWNMSNTGQSEGVKGADISITNAWDIQRESPNVKVAIIDSGIDWKHSDLAENIWQNLAEDADGDGKVLEWTGSEWQFDPDDENGIDDDGNGYIDDFIGWDFANDDNDPNDDNLHGTHVAGIVGASGNNTIGVAGVTWKVQMAALKFLKYNGIGSTSDAIEALNYALQMGMDISNHSYGGPGASGLYTALQNAAANDHLVIAAAGNEGEDTDIAPEFPAAYDLANIISVANTSQKDELSVTSNYGAVTVDIGAPGSRILSCLPNDSYGIISGTSMAAPHVTGACALLLAQQPNKISSAIKSEVLSAVDAIPALNGKTVSGGRLNVCKLLGGCANGITSCAERDSLALVAFYNATDGPNWSRKWDLSQPMNTWRGISTNNQGCIVSISLSGSGLTGSLPVELGNLTSLQVLTLSRNEFIGAIPAEIGNLFNLRTLSLYSNQLTGSIPVEIGTLNNLRRLELDQNQLTGSIPIELGNLSKLRDISITLNQLTGSIPSEIGNLTNLTSLLLNDNQLTGSIPSEIGNLNNLKTLRLMDNQLTGSIPSEIGNLNNLTILYLDDNQLTGNIPSEIGNLTSLTTLWLHNNQLTGSIPSEIGNLTNLTILILNDNQLTGSIPSEIGNLSNLTSLSLRDNQLTGSIPSEIGNLTNLTSISLHSNQLTGRIPPEIGNLNNLTGLNLNDNQLIGSIPSEIGNLTNLTQLRLQDNQLDGCIPQNFASFCKISYDFSNNPNLFNGVDFTSFCATNEGSCPCSRTTDSLSLVDLYRTTNGINWANTWDLGQPIDTWYGISINNTGCVTAINLPDNELTGPIPLNLIHLTDLQLLNLQNNQLTGCFPEYLSSFCTINYNFSGNENLPNNGDFLAFCNNQVGSCTTTDSLALVALYNSTDGANWRFSTWDLNMPYDTWSGITTNNNGRVKSISLLGGKNLTGSIPPELGNLTNLTQLTIIANNLIGSIPPELGNLTNLTLLRLYSNDLTGSIPPELGNLTKLTDFDLNANDLTGSIPPELGNLTNLTELDLRSNALTGSIPSEIGNLINLAQLRLSWNDLTGSIPSELGNLTKLTLLWLQDNQITGNIPPEISNLTNLTWLRFYDNQLTGSIPSELGSLTNLTELNLYNNQLTGSIPPELGALTKLEDLRLNDNQLSGCLSQSLSVFCNTINSDFSNNPNLPNGGEFTTFCENGTGNCSEQGFVWPGDFNNDGTVSNTDILYWGLAKNTTGPTRSGASTNWTAQSAPDWTTNINTINGKHQDGDGNGVVNAQDLQVLYNHFGETHSTTIAAASFTEGVAYRIEPKGYQGNSTFKYDLYVSLNNEPINVHGLAFTVNFNDIPATNAQLNLTNSFLNPDKYLDTFDLTNNTLEVALTRSDQINQMSTAPIGELILTVNNLEVGELMNLDITQGSRIAANGTLNSVASTSVYDVYTEFSVSSTVFLPLVSVTHEECDRLGTARIELSGGTAPYTVEWSTGATTPTITNLAAGTYTVTAKDKNGLTANYTVQIKRQYLPIYDENGDLVNCNPSATCVSSLHLDNTIPAGTHQVANTITANGTVAANSDVTLKAGESITLQPGFTAVAGSIFLATIEGCTANALQEPITPMPSYNKIKTVSTFRSQEQLAIQIRPNPLKHQAVIAYQLPVASEVQLVISDMQGRMIKSLVNNRFQKKGNHQLVFIPDDLVKGIYLVSLQTTNKVVTKKMVLLE